MRPITTPAETLISASLKTHLGYDPSLIFRAQVGGVVIGDWPTATPITTLIDTIAAGSIKLPSTYESVGQLSEDGVEFEEDISMIEIRGFGSIQVLRRDFETVDHTITFNMLEEKRIAYDLAASVDTRGIEMSADGEWSATRPSRPTTKYRRLLALAQDFEGDDMIIKGKFYPKVSLTSKETETWQSGDEPVLRGVTFGADDDPDVGGPLVEFLIGPGALAYAERMGITVASA